MSKKTDKEISGSDVPNSSRSSTMNRPTPWASTSRDHTPYTTISTPKTNSISLKLLISPEMITFIPFINKKARQKK